VLTSSLAALAAKKRLNHAYLLTGAEADTQAILLVQALNCTALSAEGQPCGSCHFCRNTASGVFSDFHYIKPEKNTISIAVMRDLQNKAALTAYEGGNKVFIIAEAEAMTDAAANSLLKTLEEPPADTFFILISQNPDKLLPTILSRCQLITFGERTSGSLDEQIIAAYAVSAEEFLKRLPEEKLWRVVSAGKEFEKDRERLVNYFALLVRLFHKYLRGEMMLPFTREKALSSAIMLEMAIDYLRRNINQKLLSDVIFLRLWQNCEK
jgi:DNA polymerase-3 subunit delta'